MCEMHYSCLSTLINISKATLSHICALVIMHAHTKQQILYFHKFVLWSQTLAETSKLLLPLVLPLLYLHEASNRQVDICSKYKHYKLLEYDFLYSETSIAQVKRNIVFQNPWLDKKGVRLINKLLLRCLASFSITSARFRCSNSALASSVPYAKTKTNWKENLWACMIHNNWTIDMLESDILKLWNQQSSNKKPFGISSPADCFSPLLGIGVLSDCFGVSSGLPFGVALELALRDLSLFVSSVFFVFGSGPGSTQGSAIFSSSSSPSSCSSDVAFQASSSSEDS